MQMAWALSHLDEVKRTCVSNELVGNEISERRIELEIERQKAGRTGTNDDEICQRGILHLICLSCIHVIHMAKFK